MVKKRTSKIAVILGTRPEIIKMSPVLRFLRKTKKDFVLIHSDQHYSSNMDSLFFRDLGLPSPHLRLRIKRGLCPAAQIGAMMAAIEQALVKVSPRHVLVQGDTNTVLAGALAANRLSLDHTRPTLSLGHVEAGLRSFDRGMPEETNRIITDHLSDWLFAPTPHARKLLLAEGIDARRIVVTGNTAVDAVYQNLQIARSKPRASQRLGLKHGKYAVMTLHRPENVDRPARLRGILEGVRRASLLLGVPVIFPVHPRTRNRMTAFGLRGIKEIRCVEPMGYLDFLRLLADACIALTDSGGIQEETCVLGVPCVTLRENTERPETVACGANRIAGVVPTGIESAVRAATRGGRAWKQPFGDGHAAEKIVRWILKAS